MSEGNETPQDPQQPQKPTEGKQFANGLPDPNNPNDPPAEGIPNNKDHDDPNAPLNAPLADSEAELRSKVPTRPLSQESGAHDDIPGYVQQDAPTLPPGPSYHPVSPEDPTDPDEGPMPLYPDSAVTIPPSQVPTLPPLNDLGIEDIANLPTPPPETAPLENAHDLTTHPGDDTLSNDNEPGTFHEVPTIPDPQPLEETPVISPEGTLVPQGDLTHLPTFPTDPYKLSPSAPVTPPLGEPPTPTPPPSHEGPTLPPQGPPSRPSGNGGGNGNGGPGAGR